MGFVRCFDNDKIIKMTTGANAELYEQLKSDVLAGEVFPAVRSKELHFYYKGGCLYKFAGGSFKRDKNFEKWYNGVEKTLSPYQLAKKQVESKFTKTSGVAAERQLLDELYRYTFCPDFRSEVVVLDIEVNLGGKSVRKCDLVLLNTATDELMFVEGKVFSDSRVKCLRGSMPEVIGQVGAYTADIAAQREAILGQYAAHIRVINSLFGTAYRPPREVIEPAKLLVYETDLSNPTVNGRYSIDTITDRLGAGNVMWVDKGARPSLKEIWKGLYGEACR